MLADLFDLVRSDLIPRVSNLHFDIIEHEEFQSFDNAFVVLQNDYLRVRIVRERGQLFVDLASRAEPQMWFDSAVIMDYLGLSEHAGFHDRDTHLVLTGLAAFPESFYKKIVIKFDSTHFAQTKSELITLRDMRAAKQLGF